MKTTSLFQPKKVGRKVIINGRLILFDTVCDDGYIITENGKITAIGHGKAPLSDGDEVIDAQNNFVSPGFIDLHTHGAGGSDFMDATVDAYLTIANTHAKYGTTALLPTTLTCPDDELFHTFEIYRQAKELNTQGSRFLGIHLEGPYFSYNQRGAQDPANLKQPVPEHYRKLLAASTDIVRWSVAPELAGALPFGKLLRDNGIIPSVGHTDAICEEVIDAYHAGYTLMTHLYSGMSSVTRRNAYRYAGAVEAAYLIDGMDVEIIADGIHLPKSLLQLIYKIKGPDHIALVTDSMRAAGMPEGEYKLGSLQQGQSVIVEEGVAKLPDRTAFAGSVATANRLVRTMVHQAGVPLAEAIRMITATPARILGLAHQIGSLRISSNADIVLFDDQIQIQCTLIQGEVIYKNERKNPILHGTN